MRVPLFAVVASLACACAASPPPPAAPAPSDGSAAAVHPPSPRTAPATTPRPLAAPVEVEGGVRAEIRCDEPFTLPLLGDELRQVDLGLYLTGPTEPVRVGLEVLADGSPANGALDWLDGHASTHTRHVLERGGRYHVLVSTSRCEAIAFLLTVEGHLRPTNTTRERALLLEEGHGEVTLDCAEEYWFRADAAPRSAQELFVEGHGFEVSVHDRRGPLMEGRRPVALRNPDERGRSREDTFVRFRVPVEGEVFLRFTHTGDDECAPQTMSFMVDRSGLYQRLLRHRREAYGR